MSACWLILLSCHDPVIHAAEVKRIETIRQFSPAVAAIFPSDGEGGGSGVVVSPDGFVITNFHVSGLGPALRVGLSDGRLYDAVICGVDPVGDLAVIKMLGRGDFPTASIGNSDRVNVGDTVLAAGNPFLLATDFTPTVTMGIISGTRRYQYPADSLLEYADCLQTDAAINPGNSGGPLFNLAGEVIGINGRGSFEKRGRVSVGVGYAISANQVQRFFHALRGGLLTDHATLGATVVADESGRVVVDQVLTSSDAYRLGLRPDDQIIRFADRPIGSVNQFKNVLASHPEGWRVPLVFRSKGVEKTIRPKLTAAHGTGELERKIKPSLPLPIPDPKRKKRTHEKAEIPEAVAREYQAKPGMINGYFNEKYLQELLDWRPSVPKGRWRFKGTTERGSVVITVADQIVGWEAGPNQFAYLIGEEWTADPPGTNGLLVLLDQWRKFMQRGRAGFQEMRYVGLRPTTDHRLLPAIETRAGSITCTWLFDPEKKTLAGLESQISPEFGACEVHFSPTHQDGIPMQWKIHADGILAVTFALEKVEQGP